MKTLHLLRHAKSSWDDPDLSDRERPLAERGRQQLRQLPACLAEGGIRPAQLLTSPARRARDTAEAVARLLGTPPVAVRQVEALYGGTVEDALALIARLDDRLDAVMLVGHNPELSALARRFAPDLPELKTCALATLRFEVATWADLPGSLAVDCRVDRPAGADRCTGGSAAEEPEPEPESEPHAVPQPDIAALLQGANITPTQEAALRRILSAPAPEPLRSRKMPPEAALRAIVASCLVQVLPNAAALAAAPAAGSGAAAQPQQLGQLHQLRIGLRRLRSALREFGGWSPLPIPDLQQRLSALFAGLGAARDLDAVNRTLLPRLRASGAPVVALTLAAHRPSPAELLHAPATAALLAELVGFAAPEPGVTGSSSARPLLRLAARRLESLHRRLLKDARHFESGTDAQRHASRKRLKRLRYCAEFVAPLAGAKPVRRYLAGLRRAADAMGCYNDLVVAERLFRSEVERDPRAWFALGWLAAQRPRLLGQAARALRRIDRHEPFWRR